MDLTTRKLVRAVVRRVHPDLFAAHPFERQRNSESLKALNAYVEQISKGIAPRSTTVEFWVKDGDRLTRLEALLPGSGTLGPLFFAFGLITEEEMRAGAGRDDVADVNFLQWLKTTVTEAVSMAEQHESLKQRIRESRAKVEHKYGLASLQVGSEFAVSPQEQQRQMEALRSLDITLSALTAEERGLDFSGLNIHLYHPDTAPVGGLGLSRAAGACPCHIADDGCLHLVADRAMLREVLPLLDLNQARVLTRVTMFWVKRVRDLSPVVKELLGVDNVWCDTRSEQNSQNFVLWAGYLLEQREEVTSAVGARRFSFSLLVHSDASSPLIDLTSNSSILQVRSDCSPKQLVEFLMSESSAQADEAAASVQRVKQEEAALLEKIRAVFGAKHVVRVCSMYESTRVLEGAQRLLENAETIKATVDLSGASLALDDCYEVWGSGFISIPYDFKLSELQPQLVRLLNAGGGGSGGGGSANGANGSAGSSSGNGNGNGTTTTSSSSSSSNGVAGGGGAGASSSGNGSASNGVSSKPAGPVAVAAHGGRRPRRELAPPPTPSVRGTGVRGPRSTLRPWPSHVPRLRHRVAHPAALPLGAARLW